ncbi:hypothetical protein D3C76_1266090 [compost metagenome]
MDAQLPAFCKMVPGLGPLKHSSFSQCLQTLKKVLSFISHTSLLQGNGHLCISACLENQGKGFKGLQPDCQYAADFGYVHAADLPAGQPGVLGQGLLASIYMKPAG